MKKKLNLRCDSLPSNCLQVKIEKAEFNLTIIDFFVHLKAAEILICRFYSTFCCQSDTISIMNFGKLDFIFNEE